jgi:hypothetical protein
MRFDVVVWDLRDADAERPDSAAGEFYTEKEARECLAQYLSEYATIYRWAIELHENGNVTYLSQGSR